MSWRWVMRWVKECMDVFCCFKKIFSIPVAGLGWCVAGSSPLWAGQPVRRHRVPDPNWDLWSVRADRIELVTSLPLSTTLQRPSDHYFLPSSMLVGPSHALWWCKTTPSPLQSQMEAQSCKPPIQHPTRPHLWPLMHLSLLVSLKCTCPHAPHPKQENEHSSVALCEDRQPTQRQQADKKSLCSDIMLIEIFWLVLTWLHTTLLISIIRYSNGHRVRSLQLEQKKNSQSGFLIVLSPAWSFRTV